MGKQRLSKNSYEREISVNELPKSDLLQYAIDNGMIDLDTIQKQIEMNERKKYLEMHDNKVWQGSNGKWYTYLPDENAKDGRKLTKKSSYDLLEDEIVGFYKQKENDTYVKDIFYMWVDSKLSYGEILKQTYDRYETDFYRFFENSKLYKVKFEFITESMLEDFIKSTIHDMKLSAKAWANLRTLINGIFKYAKKHGYTKISITQFMGDLDLSKKAFKKVIKTDEQMVFTDDEIDMIMQHINNSELSIINLGIILSFQAGLRAGEIAGLKYSDLKGHILTVSKTEIRYKDPVDKHYVFEVRDSTKGEDGIRNVVVTDFAIRTIRQARMLNPFGEYLFMRDGERIKGKAFTVKLEKMCNQLGILPRSIHKARKTYGTKLLNAGLNEKLIEKQMGHVDIETTKGYYYYNNKNMEETIGLISSAIN